MYGLLVYPPVWKHQPVDPFSIISWAGQATWPKHTPTSRNSRGPLWSGLGFTIGKPFIRPAISPLNSGGGLVDQRRYRSVGHPNIAKLKEVSGTGEDETTRIGNLDMFWILCRGGGSGSYKIKDKYTWYTCISNSRFGGCFAEVYKYSKSFPSTFLGTLSTNAVRSVRVMFRAWQREGEYNYIELWVRKRAKRLMVPCR